MREMQELSAEPRQGTGKGPAYQTRRQGRVPGILYGGKEKPEPITVDYRQLERHAGKGTFLTTPVMLAMSGRKTRVIPRAVQLDPTQPDAHFRLGRLYQAMGNTADAEREFAKVRELHEKADDLASKMARSPSRP